MVITFIHLLRCIREREAVDLFPPIPFLSTCVCEMKKRCARCATERWHLKKKGKHGLVLWKIFGGEEDSSLMETSMMEQNRIFTFKLIEVSYLVASNYICSCNSMTKLLFEWWLKFKCDRKSFVIKSFLLFHLCFDWRLKKKCRRNFWPTGIHINFSWLHFFKFLHNHPKPINTT